MTSDKYEILGVPRLATTDEIREAYLRLARTNHPDLNPGNIQAETDFKAIQLAYETLVDPVKRRDYDQGGPVKSVVYAQEFWHPPEFYWPENHSDAELQLVPRRHLSFLQSALAACLCLTILGSAGFGVYSISNSHRGKPHSRRITYVGNPAKHQSKQQHNTEKFEDAAEPQRSLLPPDTEAARDASTRDKATLQWTDVLTTESDFGDLGFGSFDEFVLPETDESTLPDDILITGSNSGDLGFGSLDEIVLSETDDSSDDLANLRFPAIAESIPTPFPSSTATSPTAAPLSFHAEYPQPSSMPAPFIADTFPSLHELPASSMNRRPDDVGPIPSFPDMPTSVSPQPGTTRTPVADMRLAPQMRQSHRNIEARYAEFFPKTSNRNSSSGSAISTNRMSTSLPGPVLSNLLRSSAFTSPGSLKKTIPQLQDATQRSGILGTPHTGFGSRASKSIYSSPGMMTNPSTPTFPLPSLTPHF